MTLLLLAEVYHLRCGPEMPFIFFKATHSAPSIIIYDLAPENRNTGHLEGEGLCVGRREKRKKPLRLKQQGLWEESLAAAYFPTRGLQYHRRWRA